MAKAINSTSKSMPSKPGPKLITSDELKLSKGGASISNPVPPKNEVKGGK